jgi:hypothetical protein
VVVQVSQRRREIWACRKMAALEKAEKDEEEVVEE